MRISDWSSDVCSADLSLGEEVGDRYDLAGGCFAIRVGEPGGYVRRGGGGFTASAATPGEAEPFRLKATDLGRYLLYGTAGDSEAGEAGTIAPAAAPSPAADRRVDDRRGTGRASRRDSGWQYV